MYVGFKQHVRRIINKHFPPTLSKRFSLRSDSEIFIPKEDEGVWLKHKYGTESIHILFDHVEIFEVPQSLDPRYAEVYFLRSFKTALEQGTISVSHVKEWTDNKAARRNKKEKQNKKKKHLEESYKWARNNSFSVQQQDKMIQDTLQKVYRIKGGEEHANTNTTTGKASNVSRVVSGNKRTDEKKQQDTKKVQRERN